MQIKYYNEHYTQIFENAAMQQQFLKVAADLETKKRIFFIGNGGSMGICSHMMEDYGKIGRFQTFAFSDAALITCYANDYGYEQAMAEWLKLHFEAGDVLVAISSSGNSANILNAVQVANEKGGDVITFSGFDVSNRLNGMGKYNFHIPARNYGVVECFHQVMLHVILDEIAQNKKA